LSGWKCAFEIAGEIEQQGFAVNGAEELKSEGQAFFREATGNGDGGDARKICGAILTEKQGARGISFPVERERIFADQRSRDGSGGKDEGGNIGVFQSTVKGGDEFGAKIEGL